MATSDRVKKAREWGEMAWGDKAWGDNGGCWRPFCKTEAVTRERNDNMVAERTKIVVDWARVGVMAWVRVCVRLGDRIKIKK